MIIHYYDQSAYYKIAKSYRFVKQNCSQDAIFAGDLKNEFYKQQSSFSFSVNPFQSSRVFQEKKSDIEKFTFAAEKVRTNYLSTIEELEEDYKEQYHSLLKYATALFDYVHEVDSYADFIKKILYEENVEPNDELLELRKTCKSMIHLAVAEMHTLAMTCVLSQDENSSVISSESFTMRSSEESAFSEDTISDGWLSLSSYDEASDDNEQDGDFFEAAQKIQSIAWSE